MLEALWLTLPEEVQRSLDTQSGLTWFDKVDIDEVEAMSLAIATTEQRDAAMESLLDPSADGDTRALLDLLVVDCKEAVGDVAPSRERMRSAWDRCPEHVRVALESFGVTLESPVKLYHLLDDVTGVLSEIHSRLDLQLSDISKALDEQTLLRVRRSTAHSVETASKRVVAMSSAEQACSLEVSRERQRSEAASSGSKRDGDSLLVEDIRRKRTRRVRVVGTPGESREDLEKAR